MTDPTLRLSTALAGRYRIEEQIGEGGMATVYRAEDLKHDRKVAVKVLRPELAAVLGAERFVQEIKTTASLQHPHILPLFDSGEANAFLYYVMPFIDGETLRDKLNRETQLGVDEAVEITTAIADALDYAHRQNVIHRDIKPENILLHDGRPMVADFGIALAVSAAAGGRMTETGLSLGTPHYMSPEQATAERDLTARSDVYSLASVLYEMLTGSPPHVGSSTQQIIMKIVTEDAAPITTFRKSVPTNVAAAVAKALEKVPADRFASAHAFAEALNDPHFVTAGTAAVGIGVARIAKPSPVTLGLAAIAIPAVILAAWGWLRSTPDPPTTREWVGLSLLRPGGTLPESWPVDLAISDDGTAIVFGDYTSEESRRIYLKEQGNAATVPIPGTDGGSNVFMSPDGAWVGFATDRGLYRIPRRGGAPIKLSDSTATLATGVFASGAWLDDGTIVFPGRDSRHLLQVDPDDGGQREVLNRENWNAQAIVRLVGLPGARGVLITSCAASPCSRGGLWMLDLRRGTVVRLVEDVSSGWYLPNGHVVYGRADGTLFAQRFDIDRGTLTGPAVPLMSGLATTSGMPAFAVSPAGTVLYATRGDAALPNVGSSLEWVDRSGTVSALDTALMLPGEEQAQLGLSLAPDGSRLALVQNTPEGSQIFVKPMPNGPMTRITFESWSGRPAWSPDGRDVVYVRYRAPAPSVAVRQRADGAGVATVIVEDPRPVEELLISPDGRWVVYRTATDGPGGADILGRRLSGDTTTVPLIATGAQETEPTISPDGRWLAYVSDEGGTSEVFVRPWPDVNSGKWQVSRNGGTEPQWNPNGRELFFRSGRAELMAAQIAAAADLRVEDIQTLFSVSGYLHGARHAAYTVSRDGERFLFGREHGDQDDPGRLILARHWFTELRPRLEGGG